MASWAGSKVWAGAAAVALAASALAASPAHAAEPADEPVIFHALAAPSDPMFRMQWDFTQVNWQRAYDAGATGKGLTVAVVDSGVTPGPDLPNVLPGWNVLTGTANAADDNGHGTHVAGTVAQSTNNGQGTAGIAGGADILPVKVLDANGDGADRNIIAGIAWAVSHGADVINLSLGGDGDGGTCAAVSAAMAQGVVVVAATGNAGGAVSYPAACPGVIAVGATTRAGYVASYSNRGPQLSLVAPGGDNRADVDADGYPDGILQWSVFGGKPGYYFESGTSMAAPHVAGAAALVKEAWPEASPAQVAEVLTETAVDKGAAGRDDLYGAGLLDVGAAVARARTLVGTPSSGGSPTADTPATPTNRIAGNNRYGTAAAIGSNGWSGRTGGTVYVASGNGFADALATGALSKRDNGPLLLTDQCSLPPDTAGALARLQPATVTIVGGPNAVCESVKAQIEQLTRATTTRLAGADRYATSVALSTAGWPQGSSTVYLASGTNFADALGAAAQAAHADAPLLLTSSAELPAAIQAEIARLGATDVKVIGGASAVSDGILGVLRTLTGAVTRIAGADRYATATMGVQQGWAAGAKTVYLASGAAFPDGLAVGPLAAKEDAPLVLVPPCDLPRSVADTLKAIKPAKLIVVGGTNAVCDSLLAKMGSAAASQ